jgi:predicted unusual protein kinase regulating ubiquinone biosynthesis (AarF/ABC1/UbiB family)
MSILILNMSDTFETSNWDDIDYSSWRYYWKLSKFYYDLYSLFLSFYIYGASSCQKKLVNFLRNSGPIFIKIGQNLMNKNSIPDSVRTHLQSLGDENFRDSTLDADNVELEENPIAAGSIAQIWKGKCGDQTIILKKLHDNIREDTIISITIFEKLKYNYKNYSWFNYAESLIEFDEIYNDLIGQLNLNNEVNNLKIFEEVFSDFSHKIILPTVLHHNENYIVETYEEGHKFHDFIKLYPEKKEEISNIIHCCYYMMFLSNFMHADIHESNFLLRMSDDHGVQIVLLDFGIVSKFSDNKTFTKFISLFRKNMFFPDQRRVVSFLADTNINPDACVERFIKRSHEHLNSLDFENKMKIMMKGNWDETDRSLEVGKVFQAILDFAQEEKMKFSGSILNVCNGFLLVDDYRYQCTGNTTTWKNKIKYAKDNGFHDVFKNKIETILNP